MEFNPSSIEKSDHIVWNSSDDHQVSGHVRSYKCAFCKKGFSNAQALGGHMNIHRRDRAKLKESSGDQSILSEKTQSGHLNASVDDDSSKLESNKEKSFTPERPWIFSREGDGVSSSKDGVGELRQLHLFVDSPSGSNYLEARNLVSEQVEESRQLNHVSSSTELDLELRLGLEHRETSTPGTREFF